MPSTTLTYSAAEGNRVAVSLRAELNLDHNATEAEFKEWIVKQIRSMVRRQERRAAEAAVTVSADVAIT